MEIKISKIEIMGSGPVKSFKEDISPLTVVYGKNESGKTTIVENIVTSLFKNKKIRFSGSSIIKLSGIENGEFKPNSSNKLDSILKKTNDRLPQGLFNLLYVRGAEVELTEENGITKTFLKNLISEQRVYRNIENELSNIAEIRNGTTKIENGTIIGNNKTILSKNYKENGVNLEKLDDLYNKYINSDISIKLAEYKKSRRELESEKDKQERAKRHRAFVLDKEIKDILRQNPGNNLQESETLIRLIEKYKNKKSDIAEINSTIKQDESYKQELEKKIQILKNTRADSNLQIISMIETNIRSHRDLKNNIKTYKGNNLEDDKKWLTNNKKIYAKYIRAKLSGQNFIMFLILGLLGIFTIFVFSNFLKPFSWIKMLFSASIFVLQFIFVLISLSQQKKGIDKNNGHNILFSIEKEFEKRFNTKLTSVEDFENQTEYLNSIALDWNKLSDYKNTIQTDFRKILNQDVSQDKWGTTAMKLKGKYEQSKNDLIKTERDLENLTKKLNGNKRKLLTENNDQANLKKDIDLSFSKFGISNINEDDWKKETTSLKEKYKKLQERRTKLEGELKGLGVESDEFVNTPQGVEFSQSRYKSILEKIKGLDTHIKDNENKILKLKQDLSEYVGTTSNLDEESLLEKIADKQQEYEKEKNLYMAKIIGAIALNKVIGNLQLSEDEQIEKYINSSEISNLLYSITKKYNKIKLDKEAVFVINDEGEKFNLNELSTGAQEQVLLALRMGISKKLLGADSLFIILDDAFQYSDWDKRNNLIKQVISLVKDHKWQVLYFTMDDNIKETFEKYATNLNGKYKLITI